MGTKKNYLGLAQQLRVKALLDDNLEGVIAEGGGKACRYKDGVSDATVAACFNDEFRCTAANVAGVREELYGPLVKRKAEPSPQETLLVRLAKLEATATHQADMIAGLASRMADLIERVRLLEVAWGDPLPATVAGANGGGSDAARAA